MIARLLGRKAAPKGAPAVGMRCTACPLAHCARGSRAAVLRMECEGGEACRLRNLGLYEGACVRVMESQDGLLLEVQGARLALGATLAASITVLPLGA
ncbi:MAG TPA: FeoA family protein [Longimicrobiaceae bacterium]|nr:FeoA family protein [Longimicrobiaceae bacterium]